MDFDRRQAEGDADDLDEARKTQRLQRTTAWLLVVCGSIGLVAAFELVIAKVRVLADATYRPSCDLNPVLSCGSVLNTPQAEVFGFPNPVLGLIGFTVVIVLGVLLVGRVELPRWVWLGLNAGAVAGFAFTQWLIWQSLYVIGAVCPWCAVVWAATTPILIWVTAANLTTGRLARPGAGAAALVTLRGVVLAAWYLTVAALIFVRWQDYWLGSLGL